MDSEADILSESQWGGKRQSAFLPTVNTHLPTAHRVHKIRSCEAQQRFPFLSHSRGPAPYMTVMPGAELSDMVHLYNKSLMVQVRILHSGRCDYCPRHTVLPNLNSPSSRQAPCSRAWGTGHAGHAPPSYLPSPCPNRFRYYSGLGTGLCPT